MKISPKIYAKALVESAGRDNKNIAARFWASLQKNKQYKDLPKILDLMDEVAAERDGKILAKIYGKNELSEPEKKTISEKLEIKFEKQVILKFYPANVTGIVIKVDDTIVDLSVENKINRLKKVLISKS